MIYWVRLLAIWFFTGATTFVVVFFFASNIATTLDANFPAVPYIGQLIFPNPQGSVLYSAELSSFVAISGVITMLIINPPADGDETE